MKKTLLFFFLALVLENTSAQPPVSNHSAKRLIFKVKSGSSLLQALQQAAPRTVGKVARPQSIANAPPELTTFLQKGRLSSFKAVKPGASTTPLAAGIERIFVAELADGALLEQVIEQMKSLPDIEYVEPDYIGESDGVLVDEANEGTDLPSSSFMTPDDPEYANQWGLRNTGQSIGGFTGVVGTDVNIEPAWDITTGNDAVLLAVLDSGIPANSADLTGRLLQGYDYANNDGDVLDDLGHGSNVTGIAAATGDNGQLMAGIDWQCRVIHMKVLDANNFGFYSWWIEALIAVADSGANVINMSLGGSGASNALRDGIDYAVNAGAIIVVSMMNVNGETPFYPAAYPNVIAVGAINNRSQRAVPFCYSTTSGSNFGNHIDFVAPGELIVGLSSSNPNGISYYCGTSQASPIVAGVVSLLLALKPDLTFEDVYDLLKAGAQDQVGPMSEDTEGWDKYFGWGLINATATVNALVTSVDDRNENAPETYVLAQNFPNPFNPETVIRYQLPWFSRIKIEIFSLLGQKVTTLVDKQQSKGAHSATWYGRDATGRAVASGVYIYRLQAGSFVEGRKMLLLR